MAEAQPLAGGEGSDCDAAYTVRPSAATLQMGQSKPTILRIKRRRGVAAPEEIILEATSAKRMRPVDILAAQLASMGVEGAASSAEQPIMEVKRRRRFQIVRTVAHSEFHSKSGDDLLQLLSAPKDAVDGAAPRSAVKGAAESCAEAGREQRRQELARHRQQLRYQQVRKREQQQADGAAAGAAEPLAGLVRLYDLEHVEQAGAQAGPAATPSATAAQAAAPARQAQHSKQQAGQQTAPPKAAAQAAKDTPAAGAAAGVAAAAAAAAAAGAAGAAGASAPGPMAVYLDMVQQYLSEHPEAQAQPGSAQRKRPTPRPRPRRPAPEQPAAQPTPAHVQQQLAQQQQQQPEDAAMSDSEEFVYDVYAPVEEGEVQEDVGDLFGEDTGCPVVQVSEDEDQFWWDTGAADQSDHDSEDSNAESFYANSYPDEEEFKGRRAGPPGLDDVEGELCSEGGSDSSEGGGGGSRREYQEYLGDQGYRSVAVKGSGYGWGGGQGGQMPAWAVGRVGGFDRDSSDGGEGSEEVDEEELQAYRESAAWRRELMMD